MNTIPQVRIAGCSVCPTRKTSEWCALRDEKLKLINTARRTRLREPGEVLFHQGDGCSGIFCIQSGLIGLRRVDEAGNSVLLRLCGGGETIGYRALLCNDEHRSTAEVLAPSVICFVERTIVTGLLSENPGLGERFLRHSIDDITKTEDAYARSLTRNLRARLLHTLVTFYQQLGFRDERDNHFVDIPLRRSQLADMIGVAPESLSRTIRKLQEEGLAQFNGRRVGMSNMDAICREIGENSWG